MIYTRNVQLAQGTDLNTIVAAGFYDGPGLANAPTADWYHIEVLRHSNQGNTYVVQRATMLSDGNQANFTYIRSCFNGTWLSWQKFVLADNREAVVSGGGANMDGLGAHKIRIGWNGSNVRATVDDVFDAGAVLTTNTLNQNYTFGSTVSVAGALTVGAGQNASYITMTDTDEGNRTLHNNSGTIGFLGNGTGWTLRSYDSGALWTAQLGDLKTYIDSKAGSGGAASGSDGVPFSAFGGVADFGGANTDNTAALSAAINSGQKVYFPAGSYYFAGRVTSINKSVNFQGAGFGLTRFYFGYGGQDAAVITCATDNTENLFTFRDIDMLAWNGSGQTYRAIDFIFPDGQGSRPDCPTVQAHLRIMPGQRGAGGAAFNWKNGYKLVNAWKPIISGSFWGTTATMAGDGYHDNSALIELDGGQFASLILTVKDFEGYYAQYGIKVNTYFESITLRSSEFVAVNKGVWNDPNFSGGGGSSVQVKGGTLWMVEGSHVASIEKGLDLNNIYYIFGALNNQKWAGANRSDWEGMRLTNCQGAKIYGGMIQGAGTGIVLTNGCNGIHIETAAGNLITGAVVTSDCQNCTIKLDSLFPSDVAGNANSNIGSSNVGFAYTQADGSVVRNKAG